MSILMKITNLLRNTVTRTPVHIQGRYFRISPALSWINQRVSSPAKERQYKDKDRVPDHYQLIYRAPMENYVAWTMHTSTLTASLITAAALYQIICNEPIVDPTTDTKLIMHAVDVYYFTAGFILINAVVRLVVSKFPIRIYKDNGKYLAVYHSQLPGGVSNHHFNKGEVKKVTYMFSPWNESTYKLGTKSSLLLENYFKTPSEFHEMSNVDKFQDE